MDNAFTPAAASELPGPRWLVDTRVRAAEGLSGVPGPSIDEEVWRYSRIGDLDLSAYAPLAGQVPGAGPEDPAGWMGGCSAALFLRNGWLVEATVSAEAAARGLRVGRLAEMDEGQGLLGSTAGAPADLFGHMNDAFTPEPVAVVVPDGLRLEAPVSVHVHSDSGSAALFPRVVVSCGADAAATVVEHHTSTGADLLVVPVLEAGVGDDGTLRHALVQDLGRRSWQLAHQAFRVGRNATLEAFAAGLGGEYARTRTDCHLVGRGAGARLTAAYFGEDDQTHDFRTFQDHAAPDTTSQLLFKGAVDGRSRSVYSGLIRVRPEAVRTRAHQTNRNLKLSADAWAQSVPNLEIQTDDVACSHASTVAPVDEEQLFYLESRGVPTPVAERLLVEGFFDEVVAAAPLEAVGRLLRSALVERLDRRFRAAGEGAAA